VHFEYLDVPCENGGLVSVSGKLRFVTNVWWQQVSGQPIQT
jgi:hypothetical protein